MKNKQLHLPKARGLYDPKNEKENCGVGFIANLKSNSSHQITQDALEMLTRMDHRGACGCEANTGDGAGFNLRMYCGLPLKVNEYVDSLAFL